MKVNSFPSLAVALAAAAFVRGPVAQDAACEGACPAAAAALPMSAVASFDDDAAELLAAKPAPARLARRQSADDPPRLGVYIDETDVGLRVDSVIEGSLAESAGVQAGDVLYRIEGRSIAGIDDVASALSTLGPGDDVALTVIREGEGIVGLSATLPRPQAQRAPAPRHPDALADGFKGGFLGVTLGETDGDGVAVVSIVPSSSAWYAGIDAGDAIVSIDGEGVSEPDDVVGAISSREAGEFVDVELLRDGERTSVRARLGQRGPSGAFGLLQRPGGGVPGLRWLEPNADGMFFFDDDDEFDFEYTEEFDLGDLEDLRFGRRLDPDGEMRFEFRPGDGPKGRVFRWKGEDVGELLEKGLGGVMRLRKGDDPGGMGKSGSLKITIEGDQVTVERDGEVETMSLDEFEGLEHIEGLDVEMFEGDTILDWARERAGSHRSDEHVEEHDEVHELEDSDV